MIIFRLIFLPFRLLLALWFRFRNLFKPGTVLYHRLPDKFVSLKPSGWLSMFVEQRESTYLEYLLFLDSLSHSDRLKTLIYHVPAPSLDWPQVEEIARRLEKMGESGCELIAYAEGGDLKTLYLMAVAGRRLGAPGAQFTSSLPASEPYYIKQTLSRLGVEAEVFASGKYKSLYEIFTRTGPSPAAKIALTHLLDELRASILERFKRVPGMTEKAAQGLVRLLKSRVLLDGETLEKSGFLEKLVLESRLPEFVVHGDLPEPPVLHGFGPQGSLEDEPSMNGNAPSGKTQADPYLEMAQRAAAVEKAMATEEQLYLRRRRLRFRAVKLRRTPALALVSMEGNIVMGRPGDDPRAEMIAALPYRAVLDSLRDSPEEAVFLFINSGGGSAAASEMLYQSVAELARRKPVFAVIGSVAASGGYYIAAAANRIYGAHTSITGSIGAISMHPNFAGLYSRLGIKRHRIGFGETQDVFSESRALKPASKAMMKKHVQTGYRLFLERVAQGRRTSTARVEKLGGGRVWSGESFLREGMLDHRGDLLQALQDYKKDAGHPEWAEFRLNMYPEIKTDLRLFADRLTPWSAAKTRVRAVSEAAGALGDLAEFLEGVSTEKAPLLYFLPPGLALRGLL